MKIIEDLRMAAQKLQVEIDNHSVGVSSISDDFKRGLKVGMQRGLHEGYNVLMRIIADHMCRNCNALIDNDADNINGYCINCAKGERDDNL